MSASGPFAKFAARLRHYWARPSGPNAAPSGGPQVTVHDPAALQPHDLDDPFFDRRAQSRMAGVIASATTHQKD
ncbi:MAG TPA: hypothetical protein VIJ78_01555 [Pseudolabrys sp.]